MADDFGDLTDNVKKGLLALSASRDPSVKKQRAHQFDWYVDRVSKKIDLTMKEAEEVFTDIFFGRVADEEKIGVFLMLQRTKGATPVEVAGMARAIKAHKIHTIGDVMEISGKEDPEKSMFCVNTAASVLAAACGCKVANVTRKSKSGSNKIFTELEVALDMSALQAMTSLDKCGIAYVRDPKQYPKKLTRLSSVQKQMGVGTSVDLLGQMSYIPGAKSGLVILNGKSYCSLMVKVIEQLGHMEKAVVASVDGNEITAQQPFHIFEIENVAPPGAEKVYKKKSWEFDPASVNIPKSRAGDLFSFGDAEEFCAVLAPGDVSNAKRDAVVLTAGLACYAYGITYSVEDGIAMARKKLDSGKCIQVLQSWLKASISARRAE